MNKRIEFLHSLVEDRFLLHNKYPWDFAQEFDITNRRDVWDRHWCIRPILSILRNESHDMSSYAASLCRVWLVERFCRLITLDRFDQGWTSIHAPTGCQDVELARMHIPIRAQLFHKCLRHLKRTIEQAWVVVVKRTYSAHSVLRQCISNTTKDLHKLG